jgi:hypothetical protein
MVDISKIFKILHYKVFEVTDLKETSHCFF